MAAFIKASSDRLFSVLPTHQFQLYDRADRRREEAEQAVKCICRQVYGADISEFSPLLVSAERYGQIDTVIGLRNAGDSRLFLENNLDAPVEQVIEQQHNLAIGRNNLVELGNLVAVRSGSSRHLFIVLAFALEAAEVEWACFTATVQVKQLLRKLALNPIEICQAREQAVVNGSSSWGRYYDNAPGVCFGNVYHAVSQLSKMPTVIAMYPQIESAVDRLAQQIRKEFAS